SSPGTITTYAISVKFPAPPTSPSPPPPPPPPPPTCACAATGAFVAPAFSPVVAGGLTGSLSLPGIGTFTIQAQSISGVPQLHIVDAGNRSVLSVSDARAWGTSGDGKYFLVAFGPQGPGAPVSIYRVTNTGAKWPLMFSPTAYADGQWGFAPNPAQMLIFQ